MADNFFDVASNFGLKGVTRERYVRYMLARWPDAQKILCQKGFAHEWAEYFATGHEFQYSDREGKRILVDMWRQSLMSQ